jgi:hypothetical protein
MKNTAGSQHLLCFLFFHGFQVVWKFAKKKNLKPKTQNPQSVKPKTPKSVKPKTQIQQPKISKT